MDERVARLKTIKHCENFIVNAAERDRDDLVQDARRRTLEIRASEHEVTSEVEKALWEGLYAYEEALSLKNGKRTRASRTRPKIKSEGIVAAIDLLVGKPKETIEYTLFLEMGLQDYAFEVIILKYPELFSPETVARSTERVASWAEE